MLIEGGSPSAFDFAALGKFERGLLERERYSCFFLSIKNFENNNSIQLL